MVMENGIKSDKLNVVEGEKEIHDERRDFASLKNFHESINNEEEIENVNNEESPILSSSTKSPFSSEEDEDDIIEDPLIIKEKPNLKNILMMSIGFLFVFSAFNTAQGYMTTIHPTSGNIGLGILYICFAFFSFFSPLIIEILGIKLSLVISSFSYVLLIISTGLNDNFKLILFITCSITGIFASVLWTVQGKILTISSGSNIGYYSGIFWAIYQGNSIIGFFLAGILKFFFSDILILFLIYSWIATFGVLLFFFVGGVNNDKEKEKKKKQQPKMKKKKEKGENKKNDKKEEKEGSTLTKIIKMIGATFVILFDLKLIFIIPAILLNGFSQSFYYGSLSKRFGENLISWTFTLFAICEVLGSFFFGKLISSSSSSSKKGICSILGGNRYVFYISFFFHLVSIGYTFLLGWNPIFYFFCIAFCGIADSGTNTVLYSMLGKYFKSQSSAVFAGFKFIQSFSICFQFFFQEKLSFFTLQLILFILSILSIICFFILDFFIAPVDSFVEKDSKEINNLNILVQIYKGIKRILKKK